MICENSLLSASNTPLDIGILVLDDSNTLSLAAAVDPLRATNRRADRQMFNWRFHAAFEDRVTLTSGLKIEASPLSTFQGDLLVVVAGFNLRKHSTPHLLAQLRKVSKSGTTLCGVDGGSWVMASAGLLNGKIATCHWEDHEDFALTFPAVNLVPDRYTLDGATWTTGGAAPCMDLMLHLIAMRHGKRLSEHVASAFVYDQVQSADAPQQRISTARLGRRHPRMIRVLAEMEANLDTPPSIAALAQNVGMSTRGLEIEFKAATGQTPGSYFLDLRLAEARRRAIDTAHPVQDIAMATGFSSQSSFARAFHTAFGQSVTALRANHR